MNGEVLSPDVMNFNVLYVLYWCALKNISLLLKKDFTTTGSKENICVHIIYIFLNLFLKMVMPLYWPIEPAQPVRQYLGVV